MNNKDAPHKLVNVILLTAVLQYLYLLYIDISTLEKVLRCADCPYRLVHLLSYVDLLYLPVLLFMFYRHMRWGWILIFGSKLFTILPSLMFYFHDYLPMPGAGLFPSFLLSVVLNAVILVLLWKQDVADIFSVTNRIKLLTVLVTGLVLLLVSLPRLIT